MIVMIDRDEVRRFENIRQVESYLSQVASSWYFEKVIEWAESDRQTYSISNGPKYIDIWYKK